MRRVETTTARGSGSWGGRAYDVDLIREETTWWDSGHASSETNTAWLARCSAPAGRRAFATEHERGRRAFATEHEREAFLRDSFGKTLTLEVLTPPPTRDIPHPLAELQAPALLSSVTFVADYVQLHFWGAGWSNYPTVNLEVMPWVYVGSRIFRPSEACHADAIVAEIDHGLVAVDELLDFGLILDWDDGVRFAVPFDPENSGGVEAVTYGGLAGNEGWIWTPGDPPVAWRAPPETAG